MHHPPPQTAPLPGQLRAGANSDLGMMTLLYSDNDVGGLEVVDRAGSWVRVPVIEAAFTVTLGDLMMGWTNDRWRSTLHRVVNPPAAANDLSRRLSIGMFFIPNYDAVVTPIAGHGEASKYPPITVADYRTSRFASTASQAAPNSPCPGRVLLVPFVIQRRRLDPGSFASAGARPGHR
jgi:isopenicillin N synthase-like dioxygenase